MLQIDLKSRIPIYEQIVYNFKRLIAKGILVENDKIPSVRDTAKEISVNPNTVQKAYKILESEGYIYTVAGKGNFINNVDDLKSKVKEEIYLRVDQLMGECKKIDISSNEIIKYIKNKF